LQHGCILTRAVASDDAERPKPGRGMQVVFLVLQG
jgi:hypothetical protein